MNKLGFYLHLSMDQNGLWEAINRVRPPVILIHADTANTMLLEEIRRFRAPDAFVIARLFKDENTQRQMLESSDPEGQGRALADEILAYNFGLATKRSANGRLFIDAWMSLNETVPGPASAQFQQQEAATRRLLANYDRFQVAFRQRLQEAGGEAVAFNFGAGNFSAPEHYLEFFPGTLAAYHYLGFHEYGWPSLLPSAGAATSAGLYRRCIEGIRRQYGDQHRVIITEAGLTRMFRNPADGDVGWLNEQEPLSEDQYWQSLAWYNDQLSQDSYVMGACLFEVGHHGNWATFRHLGQDNQGRDLHLIDRIAALNDTPQPRGATPRAPQIERKWVTISGAVTRNGAPVTGVMVRLVGSQDTLATVHQAAAAAATSITWTRRVTGMTGTRAHCWGKYVAGAVAGLTWPEFKELVGIYNPSLASTQDRFQPERTYFLPENKYAGEIVWDRPLVDFGGSIWQCWQQHLENKVVGLTYKTFKRQVTAYNPALQQDHGWFQTVRRYNLPRNAGQIEYMLLTVSGKNGRFRFANLPPGDYRIEVRVNGAQPFATGFSCQASVELPVPLQSMPLPSVARTRGIADGNFVQVAGDEFVVNGQRLRFIGVNIRGLVHYGDGQTLQWATEGHRSEQLAAARDMGVRVVRVFLPSVKANPQQTEERLRSLVTLMRSNFPSLYLLPTFSNLYADVPFRVQGDDNFYQHIDPNFNSDLLTADFFNGGYQQHYLPFVQHIVQVFRDEPAIFAWEIGNELKLNPVTGDLASDPNVATFINFMRTTADAIRQLDANHLITTGLISTHHAWLHNDDLRHRLYGSPHFDFLTVHCYNDEYENDDSALAQALHKPFIIEEAGYGNRYGPDRSGKVAEDMERWFGRGTRGYMPWGFMATSNDMGDGDGDSGLDRTLHSDWNQLFGLYRARADALAQVDPNWQPPVVTPPEPPVIPATSNFSTGQTVYAYDFVNVRKSAGHLNKLGDDILGQIAPSATATITGTAMPVDGLAWWPVHTTLQTGETVDGWAAEALATGILLGATPPPAQRGAQPARRGKHQTRRAASRGMRARGAFGVGQPAYATAYVNLRRDPGYAQKPADHVIGQIPYGAAIEILDGPTQADELTWWNVRGPLLDNSVAEGWAAEADPNGEALLSTQPPPPPQPSPTGVIGAAFQMGDAVTVVAQAANLRRSAGYINQPSDHIVATLANGVALTITGGPQVVDDLEWWQVTGAAPDGQPLAGWVAVIGPDGTRLLAKTEIAKAIQVERPFQGDWAVSQPWGVWPEFYSQIRYDGVPLKGHNGIDFGTPVGTPLVATDAGTVIKVDYEPDGFGNHVLVQHAWGESLYAHMNSVDVIQGAQLSAGDVIGSSGETGKCFGPHLHFGLRIFPYSRTDGWGGFVDPAPFMNPADLIGSRARIAAPAPMAPELPGRRRP